jgi:small ligand-binding sensory domain FIST
MTAFRFGHAQAADWQGAVAACLDQIGHVPQTGNLGFLYVTDDLADDLGQILDHLRAATGVPHWVGATGIGICATGVEYYQGPALAVMVGEFPAGAFRVFSGLTEDLALLEAEHGVWIRAAAPYLGLVHADPASPKIADLIRQLAARTSSGFLVGGLASARGEAALCADGVVRRGLCGVLFSEQVPILTRLTQGCSPMGPHHRVTQAQHNILIEIDHRPALDVLRQDLGPELAGDLASIGGLIFAGVPIKGSDTGDYLVRQLVGMDPNRGLLAIGDQVEAGDPILFCRRDTDTAREDLERMLGAIKRGLRKAPRGGIYVSCLGRGAGLFGEDSAELKLIAAELGTFPLVGFYANGEISQDRLYGYTGVLTLFP